MSWASVAGLHSISTCPGTPELKKKLDPELKKKLDTKRRIEMVLAGEEEPNMIKKSSPIQVYVLVIIIITFDIVMVVLTIN